MLAPTFRLDGLEIQLVDTPGWDDTGIPDIEILDQIGTFLKRVYSEEVRLSGIIFMHRITENRIGFRSRRYLRPFRELTGVRDLKNIIITTSMWHDPPDEIEILRERQLREDDKIFKPMLENGARMARYMRTLGSSAARDIIRMLISERKPDTLINEIVYNLINLADITDLTGVLQNARIDGDYPTARGGLADIYRAQLDDRRVVAIKLLRQVTNRKHLKCKQLAGVLKFLHIDHGVVHGDIKGDNLLMAPDGALKLTDFGLTIMHDQVMQFSETDPGGGTLRWMAPELLNEGAKRCREADMYAMGMTMLEIITGKPPFHEIQGGGGAIIKAVVVNQRTPDVSELERKPISARSYIMIGVLHRCWNHDPKERATATEVVGLLDLTGNV
ncbi:hypothetical protein FRC07_001205 [Ceratobasidium sp. 392]|nr:hypothetical protein FRC07_001205 [Ceratobasidium sp. 392]